MNTSSQQHPSDGPILPRKVLYFMLPGIVAPLLIFIFILVTESAHDEARCPYQPARSAELGAGVRVVEERRRCLPDVEERRFSLERGDLRRVLGRRRFEPAAFADGRYTWSAELSAQGEVRVVVQNEGHGQVIFREGTTEERAQGTYAPPAKRP